MFRVVDFISLRHCRVVVVVILRNNIKKNVILDQKKCCLKLQPIYLEITILQMSVVFLVSVQTGCLWYLCRQELWGYLDFRLAEHFRGWVSTSAVQTFCSRTTFHRGLKVVMNHMGKCPICLFRCNEIIGTLRELGSLYSRIAEVSHSIK